jgi:predicted transcriptional regulator
MATKTRAKGAELERLRRRIWMLRSRGMTYAQIGQAVGCTAANVAYHVKKIRQETFVQMDGAGQQEIIGEILMNYQEMRQEALRNMTQVEQGSPMRAQWLDIAARRLNAEVKFLIDVGMIQKAADRVELTVRDVRKMSDEEIEREMMRLKEELATAPVAFLEKRGGVDEAVQPQDQN